MNLRSHHKMRTPLSVRSIIILLLLLTHYSAFTQTMELDEILKIRSMDSIELRGYSLAKRFKLKGITTTPEKLLHKYYFAQDSSVWFVRSFPNDTTLDKHVYFYHGSSKLDNQFKKQVIKQLYKLDSSEDRSSDGNIMRRDIYLKDGMEIILGYESVAGRPDRYVLMFQKQFKKYINQSQPPDR